MHPLVILAIGITIVIGGILVLRLHAFLALILAALAVAALTPRAAVERRVVEQPSLRIAQAGPGYLLVDPASGHWSAARYLVLRRDARGQLRPLAEAQWDEQPPATTDEREVALARLVLEPADVELQPGDVVVHPRAWQEAQQRARQPTGERVARAFGHTAAQIGILIAMAAIIGKCLLDSGSADRIVRSALRCVGERGAPGAFVGSGFLLGIPVFFDTVFYLLIPLGKALRLRTGRNYLLYVMSIMAGATMAHSLVPPTPGPLLVAEQLGVNLGLMIVAGTLVGLFTSSVGYLFARYLNSRLEVPLRETPDMSLADLEQLAGKDTSQLPPLSLALLPILLPVALIAGAEVVDVWEVRLPPAAQAALAALGNRNIALVLAAVVAMMILAWQQRGDRLKLATAVQASLASGGVIILITSAGGAFGSMLQETGVAELVQQLPTASPSVVIVLAFLVTAAIRTAQGSATVAMITAVGVLAPIADALPCHPVYLALAIGCGSKPFSWMNDSGFWVICKMSGMTETEGLRTITPSMGVMGLAGLVATLLGAALFPLAG